MPYSETVYRERFGTANCGIFKETQRFSKRSQSVKIFVRRNSEMEQRAVIKFNAKLGRSALETYILMKQVYGTLCLSNQMFSFGTNVFRMEEIR
ncbi:hypothetical protein LAZ67_6000852 [Cordylochernes scorpioides]|uniref:Uncharacterized protein n=1 Tax=Cordylochernes scorpioides TaxID=51811 RepID=A0ABY6KJ00_9ARAC|nr:hypothetical protein LAZ67_6000852 [Cordylochernes scorpioides]